MAIAALGLALASPARATPTATATAAFAPDRLGAPAALEFSFSLQDSSGALPPPLTQVVAMLPAGSQIDTTGLGVCHSLSALAGLGVSACPTTAFTGFGSAQAAATLGSETINEPTTMTIFLGPSTPGHTVLYFYADGTSPIIEQLAFPGIQQPASPPYGSEFVVNIPPITTVPGGPDASVVSMKASIGAPNVAYYVTKRVHVGGRVVSRRVLQHVRGLVVPSRCPAGGFPYEMAFTFADGSTATAPATIACP